MKNYMEEVAKMLGVKLGEEFELIFPSPSTCHATIMLTIEGVQVINTDVYNVFNFKSYLLEHLIKGTYGIKRKPWKPTYNDEYYSIGMGGIIENGVWLNDFLDFAMYKLGNCYRTPEEAESDKFKWIKFYTSDDIIKL